MNRFKLRVVLQICTFSGMSAMLPPLLEGGCDVFLPVRCPYCQSEHVVKGGKTDTGKQRYRCHNPDCSYQSFLLDSAYKGRSPAIKQQVIDLSLNGSGVRDTGTGVGDQPHNGDSGAEKKGAFLSPVNHPLIAGLATSHVEVVLQRLAAALSRRARKKKSMVCPSFSTPR